MIYFEETNNGKRVKFRAQFDFDNNAVHLVQLENDKVKKKRYAADLEDLKALKEFALGFLERYKKREIPNVDYSKDIKLGLVNSD